MKLDPAEIIARRTDEAREHLARNYGLVCLNCDEMLSIESAFASKATPDRPAENAKPSGDRTGAGIAQVGDVERVAATLCDDVDSRIIAGQVDAPSYEDSGPHVQEYWQAIARAALARSGKGEG